MSKSTITPPWVRFVLVGLYLAAIVGANLLIGAFGPQMVIFNALVFIGLDITARDALHEQWSGRRGRLNMAILIGSGSLISAILNFSVVRIAAASFLAFAVSGAVDAVIYDRLRPRGRVIKINGSNVASAAVDSVLFPVLAFGFPLAWAVVFGQFAAKTIGGAVWAFVLERSQWI